MTDDDADRLARVEQIVIDLRTQLNKISAQVDEIHRLTKESEPLLAMAKRLPMVRLGVRK